MATDGIGPAPMSSTFRLRSFIALLFSALLVIVLDHLTKWWVASRLELNAEWPQGAPVVIHHVENTGAAFSILPNAQWLFLLVAAAVCVYILVAGHRFGSSVYRQMVLGAVLGGASSNAIDRLTQGHVIDFIDLRHWPVFNVADMAIVCGIGLALFTFRPVKPEQSQA